MSAYNQRQNISFLSLTIKQNQLFIYRVVQNLHMTHSYINFFRKLF